MQESAWPANCPGTLYDIFTTFLMTLLRVATFS